MRIAQLAPLAESVPPKLYGGTERGDRLAGGRTDRSRSRRHPVRERRFQHERQALPSWPRALRLGRKGVDPNAACALLIEGIGERARDFDVIHSHVDWLPLPVLSRTGVPFLTTMHGRLDLPGLPDVIGTFPKAPFVSISDNQRRPLPDANWIATIPHGLPNDLFRPSYEGGAYLAFLGRLTAEKGRKLPYASLAPSGCRSGSPPRYLERRRPTSRRSWSRRSTARRSNSSAKWTTSASSRSSPEPQLSCFLSIGLSRSVSSMIEAMACGTPVIAYRSGSVPEVIEDGVTGFIVDNEEQAIKAVKEAGRLDRRQDPRPLRGAFRRQSDGQAVRRELSGTGRSRSAPRLRSVSSREVSKARGRALRSDPGTTGRCSGTLASLDLLPGHPQAAPAAGRPAPAGRGERTGSNSDSTSWMPSQSGHANRCTMISNGSWRTSLDMSHLIEILQRMQVGGSKSASEPFRRPCGKPLSWHLSMAILGAPSPATTCPRA